MHEMQPGTAGPQPGPRMTERTAPRGPRRSSGRRAPARTAVAIGVSLSMVLAASCTGSSSDDAAPPESTAPSTTAVEVPEASLAAAPDCATNPFCAPGLRNTYGIDVRDGYESMAPRDVVGAVLDRSALAGVTFSADPALDAAGADLVVLEDDRSMVGSERIVPIASTKGLAAADPGLKDTLGQISAALTTEDLRTVVAGAAATEAGDADVEDWVDEHGPFDAGSGAVVIGAQSFRENQVLAQLYAAALGAAGYDASVEDVEGYRAYLWDAVVYGDVTIGLEYASSAAEYLTGYGHVSSKDVDATIDALSGAAELRDVTVLDPSEAESRNELVMRADVAEELGVTTISDLADQFPQVDEASEDDAPILTVGSGPDDPGIGDTGPRIVALQERLIALGYNPGPADGTFTDQTRSAVADFQTCQGLAPDGKVGPATEAALEDPKDCVDIEPANEGLGEPGGASAGTGAPLDPAADGSVVYMTFDDGPHPTYTPQILDLLAEYDAKATFFVIGEQVAGNESLIKREVAEGHKVQNHSWDHPQLTHLDQSHFNGEINSTNDAIVAAGAPEPTCLRPPYGAKNKNVQAWADQLGMTLVLWDVDPQDWDRPGVDAIVGNIVGNVQPGRIVLDHDGGGNREQTVAALEQVLSRLTQAGYRFEALPC